MTASPASGRGGLIPQQGTPGKHLVQRFASASFQSGNESLYIQPCLYGRASRLLSTWRPVLAKMDSRTALVASVICV